jgi:hypothetical protein
MGCRYSINWHRRSVGAHPLREFRDRIGNNWRLCIGNNWRLCIGNNWRLCITPFSRLCARRQTLAIGLQVVAALCLLFCCGGCLSAGCNRWRLLAIDLPKRAAAGIWLTRLCGSGRSVSCARGGNYLFSVDGKHDNYPW